MAEESHLMVSHVPALFTFNVLLAIGIRSQSAQLTSCIVRQHDAKLQQADSIVIPSSTNVDAAANNTAAVNDPMLSASAIVPGMAGMATGMVDSNNSYSMDYSQASYDVFDPLNWMLDGIVDFPYNFNSSGIDTMGGI